MSDTHQIENPVGVWTAALHYPVPDLLNDAGINYRDALIQSEIGLLPNGRRTILPSPSHINPAEELLIDTGELYEHRVPQAGPLTQPQLDALYLAEEDNAAQFLLNELLNFGAVEDGRWYVVHDQSGQFTIFNIQNGAVVPPSPNGNADDQAVLSGEQLENTHPQHAGVIAAIPTGGHSADSLIFRAAQDFFP